MHNTSTISVHTRQQSHDHFKRSLGVRRCVILERIPWAFASIYEKATKMVIKTYYGPLAGEIVSHLDSGTILDLGTGPGYLPIEIVKISPRLRIHGVDLGRKLIGMARANATKAGVTDRVIFRVGNAANLRFDDDTFDMVLSTGMFHMLRDPVKVLREIYRVLKPDREAWIFDPARISTQIDFEVWKASMSLIEKMAYRVFTLFSRINPPRIYNKGQIEEIISATAFEEHWVEEKNGEMKIKLRK